MANNVMHKWYDAAKRRSSVRDYTGPVDRDTFYELKRFAQTLTTEDARIEIRAKGGVLDMPKLLPNIGVAGTNCFAAVIVRDHNDYMGGYLGEAFVLECASRGGVGTCWLGGTYKRGAAKQYFDLESDERIVCVISFGKCSDFPKPPAKRSAEQLTGLDTETIRALPAWQQDAIRIAKTAPSARNRQPWELEIKPGCIGVICNSNNFGFGDVDCGIAMLHIEVGAAKQNVYGDWQINGGEKLFVSFSHGQAPVSEAPEQQE